jgi:hypothetical protein
MADGREHRIQHTTQYLDGDDIYKGHDGMIIKAAQKE